MSEFDMDQFFPTQMTFFQAFSPGWAAGAGCAKNRSWWKAKKNPTMRGA